MDFTSTKDNQLNVLAKRTLGGVVATDNTNVPNIIFSTSQELYSTAPIVYGDNVWVETEAIAVNDPETACSTTSAYDPAKTVVTNLGATIGLVDANFTKFYSQWGIGTFNTTPYGTTKAGNEQLKGYVWVSNVQNWITPYFGPLYTPAFYAVPKAYTLSELWNDGVPAASNPPPKVIDPKLYSFDYKSGILTFFLPPVDIDGLDLTNDTCYVWASNGYQYTGGSVLDMSSGGGGSGVTEDQLSTIKNIGRNAWIEGCTGYTSFDPSNGAITHYLKVFGNASNLEVNCKYSSISGNPGLLSGADPVYRWPNATDADQHTFINRRTATVGLNTLSPIVLGPVAIANLPTTSTVYQLPVVLSSFYAGGTGTTAPYYGGSRFTVNIPMTLSPSDKMGPPAIQLYSNLLTSTNITTVSITVDGFKYFTGGTLFRIPAASYQFNHIINVIGIGSSASSVKYISFTSNGTGNPEVGSQRANDLYNVTDGSGFSTAAGQLNKVYNNNAVITLTLPVNILTTRISATLTNFRYPAANSTTFIDPFFPTSNTWTGGQTNIAHVPSYVNETVIQSSNGTIANNGAVNRMYATSDAGAGALASLNGSITVINPAVANFVTSNNAIFNPIDSNLYGCNFFTSGTNSPDLTTNYILPTQTADISAAFSSGKKTLLLGFQITAPLTEFKVNLGVSNTVAAVTTMKVYWWLSGGGAPNQNWITAVASGIAQGTSSSNTCCDSFSNGLAQIKYPNSISTAYSSYFAGSVTGTIYVALDFTGRIPFSGIRIAEF